MYVTNVFLHAHSVSSNREINNNSGSSSDDKPLFEFRLVSLTRDTEIRICPLYEDI